MKHWWQEEERIAQAAEELGCSTDELRDRWRELGMKHGGDSVEALLEGARKSIGRQRRLLIQALQVEEFRETRLRESRSKGGRHKKFSNGILGEAVRILESRGADLKNDEVFRAIRPSAGLDEDSAEGFPRELYVAGIDPTSLEPDGFEYFVFRRDGEETVEQFDESSPRGTRTRPSGLRTFKDKYVALARKIVTSRRN